MLILHLKKWGLKPILNVMDNVASKNITEFLEQENIRLQLVEPHNDYVDVVKCVMQTFKIYFISGLGARDHDFLLQLWHK